MLLPPKILIKQKNNYLKSNLCLFRLLRSITLNTEDGNFSVSMLLYKDEAFEDRWTTVPSLTLDENIFVNVFMVTVQTKIAKSPKIFK